MVRREGNISTKASAAQRRREAMRARPRPRTKAAQALVLRFRLGGSFPIAWLEQRLVEVEREAAE